MRLLAVLIALLALRSLAAAEQPDDETIRYVNGEVITYDQCIERYAQLRDEYQHMQLVTPGNKAERIAFMQKALEELTDEQLMVQEAKLKKMVPDHDKVVLEVLERAKESNGQMLTLADQARARKELERSESIDFLLNYFYDERTPEITPDQLWAAYQEHRADFQRPPRAHVLAIMMLPSETALISGLDRQASDIFKAAVDVPDAALAKSANDRLNAYIAPKVTDAQQQQLLDDCLKELAAAASRTDLDAKTHDLAESAVDVLKGRAALRDLPQLHKDLNSLRDSLVMRDSDAFRDAARKSSQGPHRDEGGDQGWVEPGQFPPEVDQRIFKLPANAMSDVFEANQAAWLLLVLETQPAHVESFSEVLGILEKNLFRMRKEALRHQVAAQLRQKASIIDVVPVADLVQ